MRTLVVEFRRSLDDASAEKSGDFFRDLETTLRLQHEMLKIRYEGIAPEFWQQLIRDTIATVQDRFGWHYPVVTRISAKDAETMSKLLKAIVDSAERYSKVQDKKIIRLHREAAMLDLVNKFIGLMLPFVEERNQQPMLQAAAKFFPLFSQQHERDIGEEDDALSEF